MAYVRRTSAKAYRRSYPARTAYARTKKSTRATAYAKARAKPTVRTNRKMARKNATAIRKLRNDSYGSYQSQTSILTGSGDLTVLRDHPIAFHVNDPNSGNHGPQLYTLENGTNNLKSAGYDFRVYQGEGFWMGDYQDDDVQHMANGPMMRLNYATFDFKFSGIVKDTRIRIDFVRQKKHMTDFWDQARGKQYLPSTLMSFRNLAGFTPNRIDKTVFQVLTTKYIYLDSKAQQVSNDAGATYIMDQALTAETRRCRVSLKLNRVYKQLENTTNDLTGDDQVFNGAPGLPTMDNRANGPYKFNNLNPLSNIFCIISCDDSRSWTDAFTGTSHVNVEIIRKMTWQDKIA